MIVYILLFLIIILLISNCVLYRLYKIEKRQECTLYDMRMFLQEFINHLNIPIFIKNKPSEWFLVNEAYREFTHREKNVDEFSGKFSEDDEYVFENQESLKISTQYYDQCGQIRNVITELYPLVDVDDQQYIVGVIRDLDLEYNLSKHKRDKERKKKLQKRLNHKIRELNTILNSQTELIQKSELDGTLTYANQKYLDTFGLNKEDVTNRKINYYDLIHPDDLEQTKQIQQKFFYNAPYRGTIIQRAKTVDGYRWFEWEGIVVYDKYGNIISHMGTGRDITHWVELENRLRKSELRFRNLVYDIDTIAIQGFGHDGIINFWNKGSVNFYQYSENEVVGKHLFEVFPTYNNDRRFEELNTKLMNRELELPCELKLERKDGSIIEVLMTCGYTSDINGNDEFFCFDIDLTHYKALQNDLFINQQTYKSLVENLSECIIQLDLDLYFVYCSPRIYNILGYPPNEVLGRHLDDLFLGIDDYQTVLNEHAQVYGIQLTSQHATTNDMVSLELDLYAVYNDQGNKISYQGMLRDVTKHKRLETALMQTSNMFVNLANSAPVGLFIVDSKFNILYRNPQTYEYNLPINEQRLILDNDLIEYLNCDIDSAKSCETKINNRWFEIIVRDIIYETSDAKLVLLNDIHDKKEQSLILEHEVHKQTKQLKQVNQELESFAYVVSHDLRAPLRHIDGIVGLLHDEYHQYLDETGREYLNYLIQSVSTMNQLITGLLELSRSTRGDLIIQTSVDMTPYIYNIIESLELESNESVYIDVHPDIIMDCDVNTMNSVFMNLIHNAYKFSKDQEITCIEIGQIEIDERTIYFVCDNGIGFEQDISQKIFDVFQTNNNINSSTGIGLSTVQRIILKHEGVIWAESEPNNGAAFYFTIGGKYGV